MLICGACERELPEESYSEDQRGRRQSIRRCGECVAAGNELVLMKRGLVRLEEDDCSICSLPLPHDPSQSMFKPCCLKLMCNGCLLAARKRDIVDCPFCRAPSAKKGQTLAMVRKRVDAGDPMAMCTLGSNYRLGEYGLERDATRAVALLERAAELGVKEAHCTLGYIYDEGRITERDLARAIGHYEAAAMSGHVIARFTLGEKEEEAGNHDLALKHAMIAAKMGYQDSLDMVKSSFMRGYATKDDYANTLRGYQSAAEEMRSHDRDEAVEAKKFVDNVLSNYLKAMKK